MILHLNKTMQSENMYKTCNLYTVKNTPSEARRDASSVMYYYIDIVGDDIEPLVPRWNTLRSAIETIWDTLSVCDLTSLDGHYMCAYMKDGTSRRVWRIAVDGTVGKMRISRVR